MISYLKDVFLNMLMLALSAIITPIVLEYIYESLKLRSTIWLYQELLAKPNITYLVEKNIKPKDKNLAFLIPDGSGAGAILKTMLFVNKIDET